MRWLSTLGIKAKFTILIGSLVAGLVLTGFSVAHLSATALLNSRVQALRSIIDTAVGTADAIDKQVQSGELTKPQALDRLRERLQTMTFDKGNGYIYAYTMEGVVVSMPDPKLIGVNRIGLKLANGLMVIRDQIDGVRNNDGKFTLRFSYPKPGETVDSEKIAYVVWYKPLYLMIGTGVYLDDMQAELSSLSRSTFGLIGLVILVFTTVAALIARDIARPLLVLNGAMRQVADGDLRVEVQFTQRRDEIGMLAQALEVFKEHGLKAVALEAEAKAARASAEAERSRAEALRSREAAEDQTAITALAQGLDALANGNLAHQITAALPPKTKQLKDDFNAAAERLRTTMVTIESAIHGMSNGAGEISQAADDLSRRTEQQAASLEQTASALASITATVRKTAEGANHVEGVVASARHDATHSSGVVREAVLAMGEIDASAQQVSQIIGVINEIAFQTNLLALNAGVEAARAGDAGRGFAVVASEVRALAQRSADAAREIKQLIATSSNQVARGVKLVDETGHSLTLIVGHMAEIHTAITAIAAAAAEQATGLNEVNTAISQMDQVTQQNAAMVEQSTAASHGLAQETVELGRLTGYFQTGALIKASAGRR